MPRYKPLKITREQAAAELRRAYDKGYSMGLAGQPNTAPEDPFLWGEWSRQIAARTSEGCQEGYLEFTRRVCAVKCGELPPPPHERTS